jgi:hypothetical protein
MVQTICTVVQTDGAYNMHSSSDWWRSHHAQYLTPQPLFAFMKSMDHPSLQSLEGFFFPYRRNVVIIITNSRSEAVAFITFRYQWNLQLFLVEYIFICTPPVWKCEYWKWQYHRTFCVCAMRRRWRCVKGREWSELWCRWEGKYGGDRSLTSRCVCRRFWCD